jgi:hypothetical protein
LRIKNRTDGLSSWLHGFLLQLGSLQELLEVLLLLVQLVALQAS